MKKSDGTLYWGESFTAGPIAETDLSGTIKAEYIFFGEKRIARRDLPSGTLHYYFSDHLNSANLVYSANGTLEEDSDFYPYGGERGYTIGPNPFKFTGKERDPESGLDYFGARYYGNSLGRFLTPDWADKATSVPYTKFDDPQTLNLYGIAENTPINRIDADGHNPVLLAVGACFTNPICGGAVILTVAIAASPAAQQASRQLLQKGWDALTHTFSKNSEPSKPVPVPPPAPPKSNEQGRDAQGKFLPKQPGQTAPGAEAEKEGLASVDATKNNKPIPGSNTIPDGKTNSDGQYVEVKSGQSISNTDQLRTMGAASVNETGKPLIVVLTHPNPKVSAPARNNPNLDIRTKK